MRGNARGRQLDSLAHVGSRTLTAKVVGSATLVPTVLPEYVNSRAAHRSRAQTRQL
jgi:hypothetical protein